MTSIPALRARLEAAEDLAAVLDAAYAAFETLMALLMAHEDVDGDLVVPFLMAATSAPNGRDAILFAPSLPARPLHRSDLAHPAEQNGGPRKVSEAAQMAAELSAVLAARLTDSAGLAAAHRDRAACGDAARYAREIHDLVAGLAS